MTPERVGRRERQRDLEGIDKLPAWIQVAVFLGVLIATTFASALGVFRDKWFKKPAPLPNPQGTAVVMSASFADSQAIRDMATNLGRLVDFLEQDREDHDRRDRAMRTLMQDLLDSNDRMTGLLRQAIHPFGIAPVAPPGRQPPPGS